MTKIRFTFVDVQGNPLQNLQFKLLLKRASFNDDDTGVVLPESIEVITDTQGQAIVELWPLKTAYRVSIAAEYEDQCGKLSWSFYVPVSDEIIDAQTLYLVPPPRNIPWDEEAIGKITQAVTDSQVAAGHAKDDADRAKTEADRAEVAAGGIGNAVQEAKDAARASEASAVRAEDQVQLAADQVGLAAAQVTLAKTEADRASAGAGSANNAAIAAGAARDEAVIAQGAAESSASAANTSQLVAKDSEQRAGASATATAADRTAVQALADQVALDKLQTGQDRTVTVENAAEAKVARDEAVAAAETAQGAFVEGGLIDLSGGAYPPKPAQATLWQVDVGGTVDGIVYVKGDTLAYSKAQDTFYKQGGSGSVASVNNKTGVVVLGKSDIGLPLVDNTSDIGKPVSTAQQAAINAREPAIEPGTVHQYYRGDKTMADLALYVRNTLLTGFTASPDAAVVATDSIMAAIGKLQAQTGSRIKIGNAGLFASTSEVLTDCDLATKGGFYSVTPPTLNKPADGTFTLLHAPHGTSGNATQLCIDINTGTAMYARGQSGGVFGPWSPKLLKAGDFGLGASALNAASDAVTGFSAYGGATPGFPTGRNGQVITLMGSTTRRTRLITDHDADSLKYQRYTDSWQPVRDVLLRGDYGYGAYPPRGEPNDFVAALADANDPRPNGQYLVHTATAHSPGIYGTLTWEWYDANGWVQTVKSIANGDIWTRNRINGSTGDWINQSAKGGGTGLPVGSLTPWSFQQAPLPAGHIPANGQLLSRAVWPQLWAIASQDAVTDETWLADGRYQSRFSAGDGSTTFRMPDINGVRTGGTMAAMFLRGYGRGSSEYPGIAQFDQLQGHSFGGTDGWSLAEFATYPSAASSVANLRAAYHTPRSSPYPASTLSKIQTDGTNGTPRVGSETRPTNVAVIWCFIGGTTATNPGTVDVTALAATVSSQASQIQNLQEAMPKKWVSDWRTLAANTASIFMHNLGREVTTMLWQGRLKINYAGFNAGHIISIPVQAETAYGTGFTVQFVNNNQITIHTNNSVNVGGIHIAGTGSGAYLPWANVDIRCILSAF